MFKFEIVNPESTNYVAIRAGEPLEAVPDWVRNSHDTLRDQLVGGHLKKLVHRISGFTNETKADD